MLLALMLPQLLNLARQQNWISVHLPITKVVRRILALIRVVRLHQLSWVLDHNLIAPVVQLLLQFLALEVVHI